MYIQHRFLCWNISLHTDFLPQTLRFVVVFFSGAEQNLAEGGQQKPEVWPKQLNQARIWSCPPGLCTDWGRGGGCDLLQNPSIKARALNSTSAEGCLKPQRSLEPASKHILLFVCLVFTENRLLQLKLTGGMEKHQVKPNN